MAGLDFLPSRLSGKDTTSFAYVTIKDRLPVILTQVIDLLCQEKNEISQQYGKESKEEIKQIIGNLSKLRYELQTNKPITALTSTGSDIEAWNDYFHKEIERLGREPQWFTDDWLYSENYMYRRIKEAFELSNLLTEFDPFYKQKQKALMSSMESIEIMMEYLHNVIINIDGCNADSLRSDFDKFLQLALWANRCDLSISSGKDNAQKGNPLKKLEELVCNILVNDSDKLWETIQKISSVSNCVCLSVVLDNAGFELVSDFCFLEFLISAKLIDKIHLYVKLLPWYVSDTMDSDILWTLKVLGQSQNSIVSDFAHKWTKRLQCGDWEIEHEKYWTLPYDFSEMKNVDCDLYKKLGSADIVLFKGDLNYRKLVGDRKWNFTTPFHLALCGFLPTTLCALRTLKADVVTGLSPGQAESIQRISNNWMISGDYAIIQCVTKNNI